MIDFLKYRWLYFLISALVIGSGIVSIFIWGFKFSIEFTGGTNLEYKFDKQVGFDKINQILKKNGIEKLSVEKIGSDNSVFIKTKIIDEKKESELRKDLESSLKTKMTLLRFETVGPTLGKELIRKTIIASVLAILGILGYITFAFKNLKFAGSAIIAMIHDLLVVLGANSILSHFFGAEFDTLFVTALLTTMSFSVHDTIVIFDKVREHKRKGEESIEIVANKALSETMVRSINNSMTIVFMLLALSLLGGSTIRFFIITLLIGTITGTYSSPFIATPVLAWLEKRRVK